MRSIDVENLTSEMQNKNILIDVRTPGEFSKIHAHGAVNVPLDICSAETIMEELGDREVDAETDADHMQIFIICQSGTRARLACEKLAQCNFSEKLTIVDGGTEAWQRAGRPVVRGKGVISIERQVRIAAGFLALLGALLGYCVDPQLVAISAVVGIGLMFAGITDLCAMGLIFARMPWNSGCGKCGSK